MKKYILVVIFTLFTLRFFPLLQGKTIFFGDNYSLMVPGKIFTANWLRHGTLPFWNPYIFTGIPWVANINESVFYPSTLLFIIFDPSHAVNHTIILHTLLTALGMYVLAKYWTKRTDLGLFSAILWTFSTQVTGSINNLTTLQSITFVPWIIYASIRLNNTWKSSAFLIFCLVGQVLGGYPQYVMYSLLAGSLLSLWYKRSILRNKINLRLWLEQWMVVGLFVFGLTAFVLLPFIKDLAHSTRAIQTPSQSVMGSLHPLELVKVVLPYFFDNPAAGMKWGPSWNSMPNLVFYVTWFGIFVLGCTMLSKRRNKTDIFFGLTLLFCLLFSLGDRLPGFSHFQTLVPIFKASRGPSLILAAGNALLILWIGDALSRFALLPNTSKKLTRGLVITTGLFIFATCLVIGVFPTFWQSLDAISSQRLSQSGFHTLARDQIITTQILTSLVINVLCLLFSVFFWQRKKTLPFLLVIMIDMHWNTQGMLFFAPSSLYPTWTQIQDRSQSEQNKIVGNERILMSNFNSPYTDFGAYWEALTIRRPFSNSYVDNQELRSFTRLEQMQAGMTADWNMVYGMHALNGYTSMVPQDFSATWNDPAKDPAINNVSQIQIFDPKLKLWGISYYLVDTWFPNVSEPSLPVVEKQGELKLYQLQAPSRFQFDGTVKDLHIEENPNRILLSFRNLSATRLIVADRFDDDWQVFLNGKREVIEEDQGRRAVNLSSDATDVVFQYFPKVFYDGLLITVFATMVMVVISLYRFLKSRARKKHVNAK